MTEVYAVFTETSCYYARPELDKIFGSKADAEAYAEVLRGAVEDSEWEGYAPEPAFALVKVEPYSVN